jgi:hypothetical protein
VGLYVYSPWLVVNLEEMHAWDEGRHFGWKLELVKKVVENWKPAGRASEGK